MPDPWGLRSIWPPELRILFRYADMSIEYTVRLVATMPLLQATDYTCAVHLTLGRLIIETRRRLANNDLLLILSTPLRFCRHFIANALCFKETAAIPYNDLLDDNRLRTHKGCARIVRDNLRPSLNAFETERPATENQLLWEIHCCLTRALQLSRQLWVLPNQPAGDRSTNDPQTRVRLVQTWYVNRKRMQWVQDVHCKAWQLERNPTME